MLGAMHSLFHFSFHITDLNEARRFYGDLLGCQEGRSTDTWVDFDFFTHQISLHLVASATKVVYGKDFLADLPVRDYLKMMGERPHMQTVNADRKANMEQMMARMKAK